MNGPSFPEDRVKLDPFAKHAYLRCNPAEHHYGGYFGMHSSPTWATVEKVWGYRHVAKTLLDKQRLGSSTDFGVSVVGSLDASQKVSYHAMLGNGAGTRRETDNGKKAYLAVALRPAGGVVLVAFGDFERIENPLSRLTAQGFIGYASDTLRVGAQYATQTTEQGEGQDNASIAGASAFGTVKVPDTEVWLFARFDKMLDLNPGGEEIPWTPYANAKSNTVIAGLDWAPIPDENVVPNVYAIFYDEPDAGTKPDVGIILRLTMFYRF